MAAAEMEFRTQAESAGSEGPKENAPERLVARSFYKELREHGYMPKELLAVCIELIDLVTQDLPRRR